MIRPNISISPFPEHDELHPSERLHDGVDKLVNVISGESGSRRLPVVVCSVGAVALGVAASDLLNIDWPI